MGEGALLVRGVARIHTYRIAHRLRCGSNGGPLVRQLVFCVWPGLRPGKNHDGGRAALLLDQRLDHVDSHWLDQVLIEAAAQ